MDKLKLFSLLIIILLIINLVLRGLGKINDTVFWIIIASGGLTSYLVNKKK